MPALRRRGSCLPFAGFPVYIRMCPIIGLSKTWRGMGGCWEARSRVINFANGPSGVVLRGVAGGVAYAIYYFSFVVAGVVIYQIRTKGNFESIKVHMSAYECSECI